MRQIICFILLGLWITKVAFAFPGDHRPSFTHAFDDKTAETSAESAGTTPDVSVTATILMNEVASLAQNQKQLLYQQNQAQLDGLLNQADKTGTQFYGRMRIREGAQLFLFNAFNSILMMGGAMVFNAMSQKKMEMAQTQVMTTQAEMQVFQENQAEMNQMLEELLSGANQAIQSTQAILDDMAQSVQSIRGPQ